MFVFIIFFYLFSIKTVNAQVINCTLGPMSTMESTGLESIPKECERKILACDETIICPEGYHLFVCPSGSHCSALPTPTPS